MDVGSDPVAMDLSKPQGMVFEARVWTGLGDALLRGDPGLGRHSGWPFTSS